MNLYWPSISVHQQFQEQMMSWFDTTVSAKLYNKYNTKVSHQHGGAAIIVRDQLAHISCAWVYDTLCRWMVMLFWGRDEVSLYIVSAYWPQADKWPYSVYQQQLHYYTENSIITQSDNDLDTLLSMWIDNGDQVMLMIDANEKSSTSKSGSVRHCMENIGLNKPIYPIIINRHHHWS